ncbi:MAG: hypothetical protein GY847_01440 [Proteobacteria bacterium]|nr:hypothetical protein [Pseudomonadota bacterium]
MLLAYDNAVGLTCSLVASSKQGAFTSQVRKYSIAAYAGSISVTGTYDGQTRSNFQVEIDSVGDATRSTLPLAAETNQGAGFFVRVPDNALYFDPSNVPGDITHAFFVGQTGTLKLWDYFLPAGGCFLLGFDYTFGPLIINMYDGNTIAADMNLDYWNGEAWVPLVIVDNTILAGGTTLGLLEDRQITYTVPGEWAKSFLGEDENWRYRARLYFSDGLTGIMNVLTGKQRPWTDTGATEDSYTVACVAEADGTSNAIFEIEGESQGTLGQFECDYLQAFDSDNLQFVLWEDPAEPFISRKRATMEFYSGGMKLQSQAWMTAANANRLVLATNLPSDVDLRSSSIYNVMKVYVDGGTFDPEYWQRTADGGSIISYDDILDVVQNGFRTDITPPQEFGAYWLDDPQQHPKSEFMWAKGVPTGYYDGKIFHMAYFTTAYQYRPKGQRWFGWSIADQQTMEELSIDAVGMTLYGGYPGSPSQDQAEYRSGHCQVGQTVYAMNYCVQDWELYGSWTRTANRRFFFYDMETDDIVEGTTVGLPAEGGQHPGIGVDPVNMQLYMLGGIHATASNAKNLYRYDIDGQSWNLLAGCTADVNENVSNAVYNVHDGITRMTWFFYGGQVIEWRIDEGIFEETWDLGSSAIFGTYHDYNEYQEPKAAIVVAFEDQPDFIELSYKTNTRYYYGYTVRRAIRGKATVDELSSVNTPPAGSFNYATVSGFAFVPESRIVYSPALLTKRSSILQNYPGTHLYHPSALY